MPVECSVEVQEIREEPAGGHFACKPVQVVVPVLRQIADTALLFPYLDRENGSGAVSDAFVCGVEDFPDDATSFGRGVCSVVYGAE